MSVMVLGSVVWSDVESCDVYFSETSCMVYEYPGDKSVSALLPGVELVASSYSVLCALLGSLASPSDIGTSPG